MRLPEDQARTLFSSQKVARLATVKPDGTPHVVPVTFADLGERIVFAIDHKPKTTTQLQRLDNMAANPAVSLVVDVYGDDWSRLWWVRVDGTATARDTDEDGVDALAARYHQYVEQRPTGPVVSIAVSKWTSWAAGPEAVSG